MRRGRGAVLVMLLCCAAGAVRGAVPTDARRVEAQSALDAAGTHWDAGRYAEALATGEQALAQREAVLGRTHPDVARCLDWLGQHHLLRGNPVLAEPLLWRALSIREAALGKHHPDVARTLQSLGKLHGLQGAYGRAEPLLQRALALREAALGGNHPLVAQSLNDLAHLYWDQDRYARAEPLYLRALAIREATLGTQHLEVAQTLYDLASLYHQQGLYDRAEPLYLRALAIREAALGKHHPLVAEPLRWLGALYRQQGGYARSEPLYLRALGILEAAAGANPPDAAKAFGDLGGVYLARGEYSRAAPLLRRTVALRETLLGKSHPLVADSLFDLARLYQAQGLYGRAEPLFERVRAIREAALGEDHPAVAWSLLFLGDLFVAQGTYGRAEPLYERAQVILKAAYTEAHPYIADVLIALGRLYVAQGAHGRAEPLYARALTLLEAVCGENHPLVAELLSHLASAYQAQGLYRRAEPLHLRALAILEASQGQAHLNVAFALEPLANLHSAQGAYGRAGPLYERALAIVEATLGEEHPRVAAMLNHLAVVRLSQQRRAEAVTLFARAFALSEQRLRHEALVFSESHLTSFLQLLRTDEERLYALLRAHPGDASVRHLALGAALLLKGRSVEESAAISRAIYKRLDERDRDAFEWLGGLRTQLAQLSLEGPGALPVPEYRRRLADLSAQGTAIEADLARRSASLRLLTALPPPADIVDRVAAALPDDGALVELIAYADLPLVLEPGAPAPSRPGPLRYLALVLFPDGSTDAVDLGPAAPIDLAVSRLRDALAHRDAFEAHARVLHQRVFQPLLPLLGQARRLFLSPDGQLAFVPFAVLHDGRQFLLDAFDFVYVPSGRSLLPRSPEEALPDSVVVLADPDFGAGVLETHAPPEGATSPLATRSGPTARSDLGSRAWVSTPLPGSRREAESIQRLLPQAELFLGPAATKDRLLHLPPPAVLHLATHGFFLDDGPASLESRAVVSFGALGEEPLAPGPLDPLLRSGLVLAAERVPVPAGSQAVAPSPEGALVTALELAGLNLWGTQLVVLSACDTGRGDVKPGQGVYGLRRAFLVAGAETVVMSLWKVNDETTHGLMEAYYRHLLAGQGRAAALHEAMRELRRTQPHPHYWAPFIAMGRETPLRLSGSK
jgi:CHAT domain-containing protein/lipopolysaccharide biosynthesis regulator YciM